MGEGKTVNLSFGGTQVPDSDQPQTIHSHVQQIYSKTAIKKCVMALPEVDYEIVYEPRKDKRDALDSDQPQTTHSHVQKNLQQNCGSKSV